MKFDSGYRREFCYNDVTVTSFTDTKYSDIATEINP